MTRHLLFNTRISMQVIAVRCGFDSHSAFSRIFRRHFAVSPSAYRRGAQSNIAVQQGEAVAGGLAESRYNLS